MNELPVVSGELRSTKPMQQVGTPVPFNPMGQLTHLRDLEWFDGPLVSLYRNDIGDRFIARWCDTDQKACRWLLYRASMSEVESYDTDFTSAISPLDAFVFIVDRNENIISASILPVDEIPSDYAGSRRSDIYVRGAFGLFVPGSRQARRMAEESTRETIIALASAGF